MTNFGLMSFSLGLRYNNNQMAFSYVRKKYAKELLDKFNIKNYNAVNTPVVVDLKLTRE